MAPKMLTTTIPCRGGLNQSSNVQELLTKPGEAISLINFECSRTGGYRRISGYGFLDTAVIPGTGSVEGIRSYQGIVAVRNGNVYHSFDGTYWVQVNKDVTNGDETALLAATVIPRASGRVMSSEIIIGSTRYMLSVNGVDAPNILSIIGTERSNFTYRYREIIESGSLVGAKYCVMAKSQFIIAGMPSDPTSIYYSSHASTDLISPEDDDKEIPQENFNGATSGFISFGDVVTGVAIQREEVYVFCQQSIFKVTGLDTGEAKSIPVTRDIGCVDGFTIQEVGGDLLFLAPDGIRTIAKTERLDDIELGVISRKVHISVGSFLAPQGTFQFYSTVVREKNQYRIWAINEANADNAQRGIIAAFTYDDTKGTFDWAFSTMEGLGVTCVDNSYHEGRERIIHGNQAGRACVQETGHTFGGTRINYTYQSPYTDFGDIGIRKNFHKVTVLSKPEGSVEMGLDLRYDYENSDVHQPLTYPILPMQQPAIFGDPLVTYGDVNIFYGVAHIPDTDIYTEGSGFTVSFRVRSLGLIDDASFDIQSLQIDLTSGGKI